MFNRNIFTDTRSKWEIIADYALAICIALALTIGALHYFDILTK